MSTITLKHLLDACSPGGASVLTSVTPLEPAAGPHASVAPAKYREGKGKTSKPVFAYERRFWNGKAVTAVVIDAKPSQNNQALPEQQGRSDHVGSHRGWGPRAGPHSTH